MDELTSGCPESYQRWVAEHPSDSLLNGTVSIYALGIIDERNETNEMEEYLPGYLMIGDDSGDRAFILKCEQGSPVFAVDIGSLREQDLEMIAVSFDDWARQGFVVPEQDAGDDMPLVADIYVNGVPAGDLKTLLAIKKLVAADWPASELRQLIADQPFLALRDGHPWAFSKQLERHPNLTGCLFYMEDGRLNRIM